MSHNTASIVSFLKIWLGLDKYDFELLDYDTMKVHFKFLFLCE